MRDKPDPDCGICKGRGYTEESHGMEGPWRERLVCDCVTSEEDEDDDES